MLHVHFDSCPFATPQRLLVARALAQQETLLELHRVGVMLVTEAKSMSCLPLSFPLFSLGSRRVSQSPNSTIAI